MNHRLYRPFTCLLMATVITSSSLAFASGGDGFSENSFTPEYHVPTFELTTFANDNMRISVPSYWRVYQYISYRALTGHALTKNELDTLQINGWQVGMATDAIRYGHAAEEQAAANWVASRKAITGTDIQIGVETDAGDYNYFLNCHKDAFERASLTLSQRVAQGGQQWARVWLANQDAVFANCSPDLPNDKHPQHLERPLVVPPALPAKAPDWLVRDHAYQTASALFYAGRYDQARAQFLAIAKDKASPWQSLGAYLAARCLIRKATVQIDNPMDANNDVAARDAALNSARNELSALASQYAPAKNLMGWIDVRLRPDARRVELSELLSKADIHQDSVPLLNDYLLLLDQIEGEKMLNASDDMSAWIANMQASAEGPYTNIESEEHQKIRATALVLARAHWKKKPETHWLLAILTNAKISELTPEELKLAAAIKDTSPAFGSLQYALAKGKLMQDKAAEADLMISAMLKRPLTASVRNRWLRLKMVSAKTADEFFSAGPRVTVYDGIEIPPTNEGKVDTATAPYDEDFKQHLRSHFSLAALKQYLPKIPIKFHPWVKEMIWTRAVLMDDYATADAYTDDLMIGRDTTRHLYQAFKKAKTPAAKHDAALLILANTPELVPQVAQLSNDIVRGSYYWNCEFQIASIDHIENKSPAFLSAEVRNQAAKELEILRDLPKRSSFLIPQVIEWADAHKNNPEAPKALHFLVASTRNECTSGKELRDSRNYSKEAFQYLHRQYPRSEWTALTKYYY